MNSDGVIKVAVADDHDLFRKGIISIFSYYDDINVILEADNGQDLLNKLEGKEELPDVCLLDINMPEMDGYDTLKQIRTRWNSIRVLALSMHDHEHAILRMLKFGANGYVSKDAPPEELLSAIRSVYHLGYYHNELVNNSKVQNLINIDVNITDRERLFLIHVCDELTYAQVADKMEVSTRTVEGYRDSLFKKLDISSRTGLVTFAIRVGLVAS